jgi:ribosomal-protein-alanine N-acetyltransferase
MTIAKSGANGFRIEPLRWWDLPSVRAIESELYPDTAWSVATFWSEISQIPKTREYFVILFDAGALEVVGYGGVSVSGRQADVQTLAVKSEVQRRGLGRALLDYLLARAAGRGAKEVLLDVGGTNEPAIRLYQQSGFDEISRRKGCYRGYEETIVMRRSLAGVDLRV